MLIGTNKEKFHEHYFVFPFKCEKCGNVFMLERGIRRKIFDRFDCCERYEKYCGICAQEVIKKLEDNERRRMNK